MGEKKIPRMHFDMEVLAKSLRLASIDVIKASKTDIESQWYRSSGPVDLFFWKAKGRLVKHQMNLYGQVIEWNEFDGIKTGYIREEELREGEGVEVISFDKDPNEIVLSQAAEFLSKVESIDPPILEEIVSHYRSFDKWKYSSFKLFFKRLFLQIVKKL